MLTVCTPVDPHQHADCLYLGDSSCTIASHARSPYSSRKTLDNAPICFDQAPNISTTQRCTGAERNQGISQTLPLRTWPHDSTLRERKVTSSPSCWYSIPCRMDGARPNVSVINAKPSICRHWRSSTSSLRAACLPSTTERAVSPQDGSCASWRSKISSESACLLLPFQGSHGSKTCRPPHPHTWSPCHIGRMRG